MILHCASSNAGKLREFQAAAQHFGFPEIRIESLPGLRGIAAPSEEGRSFEENAGAKAVYYSRYSPELVFADDSGLAVDGLGGAPGIHSARFAGPEATDADNNALLLRRLADVDRRTARFVCVIALARAGGLAGMFRGEVEGTIAASPRGNNGFGYDPLFYYAPFGCTFGEAAAARKMDVSHRGKALLELLRFCRAQPSTGRS